MSSFSKLDLNALCTVDLTQGHLFIFLFRLDLSGLWFKLTMNYRSSFPTFVKIPCKKISNSGFRCPISM